MSGKKVEELVEALEEGWEEVSFGYVAEDISVTEYDDSRYMIEEAIRAFLHQEIVDEYDPEGVDDKLYSKEDKKVAMSVFLHKVANEVLGEKYDRWD